MPGAYRAIHRADGRETFMHSTLIQDAVRCNLQTIGQSVSRLSETLRKAHPEIDWRSIIGLRNVLVHDYLGINLERIWDIIERDVPHLECYLGIKPLQEKDLMPHARQG